MSKLGDLIVRLRLQYDDYKKGLKKADADTKGFAGTLGKIRGVGIAVWGAIGAGATAMARSFINHSQIMGDKWNQGVNQMKAVWSQFLTSLTSWDWEGFGERIKAAMGAASESTFAHDAEFEVGNSIKMRKAAMAEELAQLQVLMRDTGKSYEVRAKAAEDYLNKVKPLYEAEEALRKRIYLTDTDEYLKNAGLQANADNRDLLRKFFIDIAPNESLMAILIEYQKKVQGKKRYNLSQEDYKVLDAFYDQYGNKAGAALSVMATYYQNTNDDIANKAVNAIINYDNAIAMFAEETRRVQTLQNSALAQIAKSAEVTATTGEAVIRKDLGLAALDPITGSAISGSAPTIFTDQWLSDQIAKGEEFNRWYNDMVGRVDQMNGLLNESILNATVGGMQAFTDMLLGLEGADASDVLAALLQPFADMMIQMGVILMTTGEGIDAFKKSLTSLDPKVAFAAGLALVALGSAMGSALRSLGGSGTSASGSNGGYNSGNSSSLTNYESTLTVEVVGKISGNDIVLSGKKTNEKNSR